MLIELLLQSRFALDAFVSERIAPDEVEAAFSCMEKGEVLRSVVVLEAGADRAARPAGPRRVRVVPARRSARPTATPARRRSCCRPQVASVELGEAGAVDTVIEDVEGWVEVEGNPTMKTWSQHTTAACMPLPVLPPASARRVVRAQELRRSMPVPCGPVVPERPAQGTVMPCRPR